MRKTDTVNLRNSPKGHSRIEVIRYQCVQKFWKHDRVIDPTIWMRASAFEPRLQEPHVDVLTQSDSEISDDSHLLNIEMQLGSIMPEISNTVLKVLCIQYQETIAPGLQGQIDQVTYPSLGGPHNYREYRQNHRNSCHYFAHNTHN